MSWPIGVNPEDYREVSVSKIEFPPGDPLEQMAGLPGLPPGTVMTVRAAERAPAEAELARINDILRKHGFDYPLGSRGVDDLATGYAVRQEELHRLDPEHWAPARDVL